MERKLDPRTIVTPYAFAVHPDLLGMPLATPWQRLGAISIDLVVIGFLSLVGLGPLAIASTALLFWLATRKPTRDTMGRFFKIAVGCLGFMILGITALVVFLMNSEPVQEVFEQVRTQVEAASQGDPPTGAPPTGAPPTGAPPTGEVEAGDPDPGLGDRAVAAVDSIENLNRELTLAREDQENLQEALEQTNALLEEERNRGPLGWLLGIIDDIGVGSLWAVVYLTVTHAWWKGRSIGKKLFGIRVVMIDKRPLNWWLSFERVGGYAAGLATGLLGFAQIFWDPNRQAIHDKVSETIVIREGMTPVPGPWIQEGKAQWTRGQHGPNEENLQK